MYEGTLSCGVVVTDTSSQKGQTDLKSQCGGKRSIKEHFRRDDDAGHDDKDESVCDRATARAVRVSSGLCFWLEKHRNGLGWHGLWERLSNLKTKRPRELWNAGTTGGDGTFRDKGR